MKILLMELLWNNLWNPMRPHEEYHKKQPQEKRIQGEPTGYCKEHGWVTAKERARRIICPTCNKFIKEKPEEEVPPPPQRRRRPS